MGPDPVLGLVRIPGMPARRIAPLLPPQVGSTWTLEEGLALFEILGLGECVDAPGRDALDRAARPIRADLGDYFQQRNDAFRV
jgi:hypothetical protein